MQERGEAVPSSSASGFAENEPLCARHFDELGHSPCFSDCDRLAERSDAVVATPFIIELRGRAVARLAQQSLLEHSLNGAVQRACAKAELAVGSLLYILDDRVSVAVFFRDSDKDVERCRRQWKQRVDGSSVMWHAPL